uniref:homeobox protein Hox-B8a-like n=1 Tax=Oncorhynchus gorbuscha TaxID=8017 RepID=UPI001EAF2931|nr:homeobox protein Hox-B8a-like [Oncorhynchus gorbuscha]
MSSYFVNALFSKNSNSESWNSDYGLAHDLGSTSSVSYGYGAGGTIQQPHPTQLTVLYNGTSLFKTAHQHQLNPCVLSLPMGNLYHAHDVIQRPTFYASHNTDCIQFSDYHLKSTGVANDSVCAEQCSSLPDLFPWMKPQVTGPRRGRQADSRFQTLELEKEFLFNSYLTRERKVEVSHALALTELKDTFLINRPDQNEIKKQSKETYKNIQTSDEEGKD